MARPRPENKRETTPALAKILPMQLRVGDRLVDESGEWEVIARPYATAGGKSTHVRVQRVDKRGH